MKRSAILFAVLGMVLALASAAQAEIITSPQDGYTGPYRLAFYTDDSFSPTNTDIEVYNDSVSVSASNVAELVALSNTTWKAIVSTETVNARDNTDTRPPYDIYAANTVSNYNIATDFPIYNFSGVRLADNNLDLWGDNTIADVMTDDAGVRPIPGSVHGPQIMTGTLFDGTTADERFGTPGEYWVGRTGTNNHSVAVSRMWINDEEVQGGWIYGANQSWTGDPGMRLMAMSSVIAGSGGVGTIVEIK
jgi:hypothetical protein